MIFVTVGSSSIPFDRLLRAVEAMRIDETVVVQHGTSAIRPARANCVDFLDYDAFLQHVREARVVVTHAGVGSIMTSLAERRRPIVFPRRSDLGECVDNHQVSFAERVSQIGLVALVEDAERLEAAIREHGAGDLELQPRSTALESELRTYIQTSVRRRKTSIASSRSEA